MKTLETLIREYHRLIFPFFVLPAISVLATWIVFSWVFLDVGWFTIDHRLMWTVRIAAGVVSVVFCAGAGLLYEDYILSRFWAADAVQIRVRRDYLFKYSASDLHILYRWETGSFQIQSSGRFPSTEDKTTMTLFSIDRETEKLGVVAGMAVTRPVRLVLF